ncbi:hypothetical protein ACOMHN_054714 [Nucella lapillus]
MYTAWTVTEVYLAIVLVLGVMATVLACWVLHVHHRPDTHPVSSSMRFTITRILRPLWNFNPCSRLKRNNAIQVKEAVTPHRPADLDKRVQSPKQGFRMSKPTSASADSV